MLWSANDVFILMTDPTLPIVCSTYGLSAVWLGVAWLWRACWLGRHGTAIASNSTPLPPIPLKYRGSGVAAGPYTRIDLLAAVAVISLFACITWTNLQAGDVPAEEVNPLGLVLSIIMQLMIAGLIAAWVSCRYPLVEWLGLCWPRWSSIFWLTPVSLGGVWLTLWLLTQAGLIQFLERIGVETAQDSVKLLRETTNPHIVSLMAVAAIVVAPLCEEVVFRGYLYPAIKHHCGAFSAAMISALVFSAAHGSLVALIPLFVMGLVFVWLYEKTGSIWAPMALHAAFNSATVVAQMAARWMELPTQAP